MYLYFIQIKQLKMSLYTQYLNIILNAFFVFKLYNNIKKKNTNLKTLYIIQLFT